MSEFDAAAPPTSGQQPLPLPSPPLLHGRQPRKHWNALALAYLGDSVWELYARRHHFFPPRAMTSYHADVRACVRAEAQDAAYGRLRGGAFLTPEEADVLRWGRNATGTVPKRFAAAGLKTQAYRHATAVEVLVAHLYLSDPARLHALMQHLGLGGGGGAAGVPARGAGGAAGGGSGSGSEDEQ